MPDRTPPPLPTRHGALFLDFDGTLVELADRPDGIRVPPTLPALLDQLNHHLDGALAVVTGRALAVVDHYLQPLRLSAAGVHGAERRIGDGITHHVPTPPLDAAAAMIEALCTQHPGLLMERKPGALALHYRQAPALAAACEAAMHDALAHAPGMALQHGKRVIEMKPAAASKGAAVQAFLQSAPFLARRPWFVGDDLTDESAIAYVQSVGGVGIRVGDGASQALHRLPDPAAVRAWLSQTLTQREGATPT